MFTSLIFARQLGFDELKQFDQCRLPWKTYTSQPLFSELQERLKIC